MSTHPCDFMECKGTLLPLYSRNQITINKDREKQAIRTPNTSDVPPTHIESFPHIFPNLPLIISTYFSGLVRNSTEHTFLVCNNSRVFPLFVRNFSCVNYALNLHTHTKKERSSDLKQRTLFGRIKLNIFTIRPQIKQQFCL
jgi:hypothetical protein